MCVTTKRFDAVAGVSVPDTEGFVVRGGADVVGIGGPGDVVDAFGVAGEAVEEGESGGGVDDKGFVEGSGSEEVSVVGEFDAGNGACVGC